MPTIGVADLDVVELPSPRADALGVVVLEGFASAVTEQSSAGWTIATPCGATRDGVEPAPTTALVVLDPAGDASAAGRADIVERNADLARAVQTRLADVGVETLLTRDAEADVAATIRRDAAEGSGALVVVSISLVDGTGDLAESPALEVVHPASDAEGRRLAGLIHASLRPVLDGMSVGWPDDVDAGVRAVLNQRGTDYFVMLRERSGAARTVIHLPVDPNASPLLFADEGVGPAVADAIADAIARHLITTDEGDGFVSTTEIVREAPTVASTGPCIDPLVVEPSE